jgi:hypothetical protein
MLWNGDECGKNQGDENVKPISFNAGYDRSKQPENVEYFNYLGSMLTGDARCTHEIKSRIALAKAAFNKKKTVFTSKLGLNLRKKLVNSYIWYIALYGAEAWTIWKVDEKYVEVLKRDTGEGWRR